MLAGSSTTPTRKPAPSKLRSPNSRCVPAPQIRIESVLMAPGPSYEPVGDQPGGGDSETEQDPRIWRTHGQQDGQDDRRHDLLAQASQVEPGQVTSSLLLG